MNQNELLDFIPIGKENAITNYELALLTDVRVVCLNRMLKKLAKYNIICCEDDCDRHYKSKKYYKI